MEPCWAVPGPSSGPVQRHWKPLGPSCIVGNSYKVETPKNIGNPGRKSQMFAFRGTRLGRRAPTEACPG
eukprot:1047501-Pyramimonas_sp.AAC.1